MDDEREITRLLMAAAGGDVNAMDEVFATASKAMRHGET